MEFSSFRASWDCAREKTISAQFTAQQRQSGEMIKTLVGQTPHICDRLVAGLNLVGTYLPGFEKKVASFISNSSRFPTPEKQLEPIGCGAQQRVFRFSTGDQYWVLKVDRLSSNLAAGNLNQRVAELTGMYQQIKNWYQDVPGLILDEYFLITESYIPNRNAVASIQSDLGTNLRNVYVGQTPERLAELARKNPQLAFQFPIFAEKFVNLFYTPPWQSIDVLGDLNLALVGEEPNARMVLIDTHGVFNDQTLTKLAPDNENVKKAKLQQAADFMEETLSRMGNKNGN